MWGGIGFIHGILPSLIVPIISEPPKLKPGREHIYADSSAAFFALLPLGLFSGVSFFGLCDWRMALARATASGRRSAR